MQKSKQLLVNAAIGTILIVCLFHVCVLVGIIPYSIVWGGRLTNVSNMIVFETISLSINALIIFVLMNYAGYVHVLNHKVVRVLLWVLGGIFALNTVGNLFAVSSLEKLVFTPLTAILAILFFLLARRG